MSIHRIRLRGPWQVIAPGIAARSITVPCAWHASELADERGTFTLCRAFGRPTNLDAAERVWLTFAEVIGDATVRLNGRGLGVVVGCAEFDVTEQLLSRNELLVELLVADDNCGIVGDVALEIRQRPGIQPPAERSSA